MTTITIPPHVIFQVAYVVPDIEKAIPHFARELNLGAWAKFDNVKFADVKYRGKPSAMRSSAAMACSGNTMYELVQQLDDLPSIYMETIKTSGYGFHHFGKLVPSLDEEIEKYRADGFDAAMELNSGSGVRVAFIDTRSVLPGMMELVELSETVMGFISIPFHSARTLDTGEVTIDRY